MDSVWMDVSMPRFPKLNGDITTDVLVIGGGMAGLLTAYLLKKAGVNAVVAEADRIGMGVTGKTTAKITSQHGLIYHAIAAQSGLEMARMYLQANQEAVNAFRKLCRGIDCDYEEQNNFIYSRTDRKSLDDELYVLDSLGFPVEYVRELPLPFPVAGAVMFPHQGQFHPMKFLSAIAGNLTIYENTPVRQIQGTTALCGNGQIRAEKILIATHFPIMNSHGAYFLKLFQQRSYVLALEGIPGWEGMYLDEQENGLSFRHHNGICLLGGGGHRTGKVGGGWQELEEFAAFHYPDARILRRWATQDCMSLDGIPYIGHYSPATPELFVATGFNKWGMSSSMAAATVLTDLIMGKENPYEALFSPSRSMLHPQLGSNILESAINFLRPTAPRCSHMGCALRWNPREHSWDCPCHGSRFSEKGKLLDNPATGDLKKRSWCSASFS